MNGLIMIIVLTFGIIIGGILGAGLQANVESIDFNKIVSNLFGSLETKEDVTILKRNE